MKKLLAVGVALTIFVVATNVLYAQARRFNVYTDKTAKDNHYFPSGWMGDWGDLKLDTSWKDNPHSGTTCIKIVYTAEQKQGAGWAGIYWQNPPNNWGTMQGGYNLTGLSRLIFWVRGEKGSEVLAEAKVGGIQGEFSDSDSVSIGPITLTKEWKEYTIDLKDENLSYISGGFCWAANTVDNPDGFTIYFDDIYYEE